MNKQECERLLEEAIYQRAAETIAAWDEPDVYMISFFSWQDEENMCKPRLTIGYNTESQFNESLSSSGDYADARWNYAWHLQDEENFSTFGSGEFSNSESDPDADELIRQWVRTFDVVYYENDDDCPDFEDDEEWEQYEVIDQAFSQLLARVVQRLHAEGVVRARFGKELPIIIHYLEYYDEILKLNIEANGEELIDKDFRNLCLGLD